MDNLTELKAIWHSAKTDDLPDAAEMLQVIKRFRSRRLRKKWMVIGTAGLLAVLMCVVLLCSEFQLVSTYVGGILIASAALLLAVNNIRSLKRFNRLDNCSNREFLNFIEQTRLNQIYFYKRTQVVMMILCSVGLMLYLLEPAAKDLRMTLVLLAGTFGWLMFSWLVIRPRVFKRNQKRLEELRSRIEHISDQLR